MAQLVALTGFMGSGKSSIGAAVATKLGWRFVDLDKAVEKASGESTAAFFESKGERAFRDLECEALEGVFEALETKGDVVLALGGGTLHDPRSSELLHGRGGVVLLDVDEDTAWARASRSDRPLARERLAFCSLLRERWPGYEAAADWVVPVGSRSVEEVATELCGIVNAAAGNWQSLWGRLLAGTERPSLIVGGGNALRFLAPRAAEVRTGGGRLHVVTDRNVVAAWGDEVASLLGEAEVESAFVLEPGETSKSVAVLGRCWEWLAGRGARRADVVVALGGGVVGDLAGFAAATYHRGVALWQVPTSLLAQVDSSVGGKTAVNLESGKNLVGAFYQPNLVVADPATLATLPDEEYVGGLGEVVKHALLASAEGLAWLERNAKSVTERDPEVMGRLVKQNVALKAAVVEKDEREAGCRAMLNLGHTTAHALEAISGYGHIAHGRAVALGLLVALAVSEKLLGLDPAVRTRTGRLMGEVGLQTVAEFPATEAVSGAASFDKKSSSESTGFVGLRALGEPVWGVDVPPEVFREALEVIRT